VLAVLVAPGASADPVPVRPGPDVSAQATSWADAAATLGPAGMLWEPRHLAGLRRRGGILVAGQDLTVSHGASTGGRTSAVAHAGGGPRTVVVQEKWSPTGWLAPVIRAVVRVGTVRLAAAGPGRPHATVATLYARCRAVRGCTRADIATQGGSIVLTARPASGASTGPGTTVVITSTGVSAASLTAIARTLMDVPGEPTVAGSAQMVGMCRQMVDGHLTGEQAIGFAGESGFTARIGSIDGQSQPGTADHRADRFTLSLVGGAVVSCSYG
jgi:hypothetical protein